MTKGLVLIGWDEFEGAQLTHVVPPDLEVDDNVVTRVQIAHNFTTSWMITREEDFNGISYYDPEHGYVILLVLDKYDDGQDYREIIDQVNELLLSNPPADAISSELEKIYALSHSVYKAREAVLMKLAQQVSQLKIFQHDVTRALRVALGVCREPTTKVLLGIALLDSATPQQLVDACGLEESVVDAALEELVQRGVVKRSGALHFVA